MTRAVYRGNRANLPEQTIQRAYHNLAAIDEAGLLLDFKDDYCGMVNELRERGCVSYQPAPLRMLSRLRLADELAGVLNEDRNRVRCIVRRMYSGERVVHTLKLLAEYAELARKEAQA